MRRIAYLLLLAGIARQAMARDRHVDLCVYGGTSAGVIAAYTAAKLGKSVLLVEPGRHLGGMSSGGLGQTDIGNKVAITGFARDFYRRIGKRYGRSEQWTFEPHVAEEVFREYVAEAGIEILYGKHVIRAQKKGTRIEQIEIDEQPAGAAEHIFAAMFVDCSYEGDLMALAGVSYTVGREANSEYHETLDGVQLLDKHQFPNGVDPYKIPGDPASGLLWGIASGELAPAGTGDKKIQAYNFRLCLTDDPANRIAIARPVDYDSSKYELLLRQLAICSPDSLNWQLMHIAPMPNRKTDINNCGGFSSDMIGMNYEYAEASILLRQQIIRAHESYTKGWLYFLGHDRRVAESLRNEMLEYGYPADEFMDNDHFSHQLYIREARRMVSAYVMTQHNCQGDEVVSDGIGLAAYTMDSHNCERIVVNGMAKNEGDVQVGGFGPYPVSYRSIVPRQSECSNLLVPVCLSASHIAYGSIRMEPVFMVLGEAAARAAVMAIEDRTDIQDIKIKKLQQVLHHTR